MRFSGQNKKSVDARYFLYEQATPAPATAQPATGAKQADNVPNVTGSGQVGGGSSTDTSAPQDFKPAIEQGALSQGSAIVARAKSQLNAETQYSLGEDGLNPKPDPSLQPGSKMVCDCSGFVSWAYGRRAEGRMFDKYLLQPVLNVMPGDVIARGKTTKGQYPHFGIVTNVIPAGSTSDQIINDPKNHKVEVVHCTRPAKGKVNGGVVLMQDALAEGFAGNPPVPVAFFRPTNLVGSLSESKRSSEMRHNLWDRMMYRLLQEKKEKEVKASKSKGSKPDFLDLDKDGDTSEPMKKASKESGGKKETNTKKGKGKIPPQLKMHIKKKKSKLDEAIERLERILINEAIPEDYENEKEPLLQPGEMFARITFEPLLGGGDTGYFRGSKEDVEARTERARGFQQNSPLYRKYREKVDSGEWKKDPRAKDYNQLYNFWVDEMAQLFESKFEPIGAKMYEHRGKLIIQLVSEDVEEIREFIEIVKEDPDSLKEMGGSNLLLGGDKINHYNNSSNQYEQPLKRYDTGVVQKNKYSISFPEGYDGINKIDFEKLFAEEGEVSAPGAVSFGGIQEYDQGMEENLYEYEEYLTEAEVKKKQPRLGKVTRNPSGSKKKFHVYVKCGGRVKKISFGDPGLSIKRDSAARRKNFRARHKCDQPAGKDRCTARYWSCYQWRAGKKVEGEE